MTIYPIKPMQDNRSRIEKAVCLSGVSKKYSFLKTKEKHDHGQPNEFWALKDLSLEIGRGQILGIIGRNGAGKTTLLNIIAQTLSPSQGEIKISGKALGLFNLGVGFQDELTGKENIFLNGAIMGASRKESEDKLQAIIEFSELGNFINMPLGSYSQGMRLRLGFSIIANLDFDILLVDEVLAVGDTLFQSKCFERLMDFKRAGKTLVITSQNMDLIERLCDSVVLLNHGRMLFAGNTAEGTNRYRALLNSEKFFVGPAQEAADLFENTKKWADDVANWGTVLGTKEVVIESVKIINKFGLPSAQIKSGDPMKIRVEFSAKNAIKEPHFGVAIFRNDGVYCYGPNSAFDGYHLPELKAVRGYFILSYRRLMLAPGEYRISIAVWDKFETLAFSYHDGYYALRVSGRKNLSGQLLNLPWQSRPRAFINFQNRNNDFPNQDFLKDKWGKSFGSPEIEIESLNLLDQRGTERQGFITNAAVNLVITFKRPLVSIKNRLFWLGVFRDDGIYCQGITLSAAAGKTYKILFRTLPLLPGSYRISIGVWDLKINEFIFFQHAVYPFFMKFSRQDHGTVYLRHHWRWRKG